MQYVIDGCHYNFDSRFFFSTPHISNSFHKRALELHGKRPLEKDINVVSQVGYPVFDLQAGKKSRALACSEAWLNRLR